MDESEQTTGETSSSSTSTSSTSSSTSIQWHLRSTTRRRLRQETVQSEPSLHDPSITIPKRSQSAPGTVERISEIELQIPSKPPRDSLVTVKFALPTGEVLTRAFPGLTSVAKVRDVLAPLVGANRQDLVLSKVSAESRAEDSEFLADLGVGTFGVLSLKITAPLDAKLRHDSGDVLTAPPPDVLTVVVRSAKEKRAREVVVEVQKSTAATAKPFLGGLRNTITGATFHHATTQTDRVQPIRLTERSSRDTQAGSQRWKATATFDERIVQTSVPPKTTDGYIVLHGDPERFEADRTRRFRSACVLQRCLRSWIKRRKQLRIQTQEATPTPLFTEMLDSEIHREPDIQSLLNSVYEWRREEEERLQKITAVLTQRAERLDVLAEEARRLAQIDAVRVQRRETLRRRQLEEALKKAARPKSWRGWKGRRLEADTPTTMRYRRLLQLYEKTMGSWRNSAESLREIADELESLLEGLAPAGDVSRLESLIRRRATYLDRGTAGDGLAHLERVRDMFLEIPQTTRGPRQIPSGATCRSCGRLLPARRFAHHSRVRSMRRCIPCAKMSTRTQDLAIDAKLRHLTEMMRKNEIQMGDGLKSPAGSQAAFLLQPEDIRLLATRIWPGRSILGGAAELDRLRLGRWDSGKPFSPWNCVLLTESELSAHIGATTTNGPEEVYAPPLVARVRRRHLQASLEFRSSVSSRRVSTTELDKAREIDNSETNPFNPF